MDYVSNKKQCCTVRYDFLCTPIPLHRDLITTAGPFEQKTYWAHPPKPQMQASGSIHVQGSIRLRLRDKCPHSLLADTPYIYAPWRSGLCLQQNIERWTVFAPSSPTLDGEWRSHQPWGPPRHLAEKNGMGKDEKGTFPLMETASTWCWDFLILYLRYLNWHRVGSKLPTSQRKRAFVNALPHVGIS